MSYEYIERKIEEIGSEMDSITRKVKNDNQRTYEVLFEVYNGVVKQMQNAGFIEKLFLKRRAKMVAKGLEELAESGRKLTTIQSNSGGVQ